MATSNIKKDDDEHEQWETADAIHKWNDSSDDEKDDIDHHEFYDAHDTNIHPSTETNTEAELLHKRLNAQLSTDEQVKKKSPG
jgi:hypothetical protein